MQCRIAILHHYPVKSVCRIAVILYNSGFYVAQNGKGSIAVENLPAKLGLGRSFLASYRSQGGVGRFGLDMAVDTASEHLDRLKEPLFLEPNLTGSFDAPAEVDCFSCTRRISRMSTCDVATVVIVFKVRLCTIQCNSLRLAELNR